MAVVALHRRDPLDVHHSLLTLARAGIALARRRERPSPQVRHRLRAVTAWCVLAEPAFLAATTLDYLGGVKTLVAGLEGRRRILQRHHPVLCSHCPESRQHYVCAEHYAVNWDECPDRLDAASGLETTDG
jgi:hypothetical protein